MRRHPGGVCVLSLGYGASANGMAVTSATSFSLEPPAVFVCVNMAASVCASLVEGADFCLTVFGGQHEGIARAFSRKPSGLARFGCGRWRVEPAAPPWLEDAPANLECHLVARLVFGSHVGVLGAVRDVRLGPSSTGLVYHEGVYNPLGSERSSCLTS